MDPILQALIEKWSLEPSTSSIEAIMKVFEHGDDAKKIVEYCIIKFGDLQDPTPVPDGTTVHACCGGYGELAWPPVDPWVGINGDLVIDGVNYHFECRSYAVDTDHCKSFATINNRKIDGGMDLHFDILSDETGLGEKLVIAFDFAEVPAGPDGPGSPALWLLAKIDVASL